MPEPAWKHKSSNCRPFKNINIHWDGLQFVCVSLCQSLLKTTSCPIADHAEMLILVETVCNCYALAYDFKTELRRCSLGRGHELNEKFMLSSTGVTLFFSSGPSAPKFFLLSTTVEKEGITLDEFSSCRNFAGVEDAFRCWYTSRSSICLPSQSLPTPSAIPLPTVSFTTSDDELAPPLLDEPAAEGRGGLELLVPQRRHTVRD